MALTVKSWSAEQWLSARAGWTGLLMRSDADRLFLSWEWLTTWWNCFGLKRGELRVLAAYRGTELVGLAPLYCLDARRRMVPVRSLQFIGTAWRDSSALISEYLDFIALRGDEDEVRAAFLDAVLEGRDWSEFVIGYGRSPENWPRACAASAAANGTYGRATEHCVSHQADLGNGFETYLRGLGQSTRRSVWHLRRRLGAPGEYSFEAVQAHELETAFADLNRLHALRWGYPAFADDRLRFHLTLTRLLATQGELAMTRLTIRGKVESVLYDVRRGARQYNLKMAFDPAAERGFSLGLIHFGFAMESAAAAGITLYDFLAGPGRRTDFKVHLGQRHEALATVQLLRGPLLSNLYRWYDSNARKRDGKHN